MAGKKIPEETKEKAVSLYKSGMSMRRISMELDISYRTVGRIVEAIKDQTREKKETTMNMTALQAKEWDFWAAVRRGDLIIMTREEADALRERVRPSDTGIGWRDHGGPDPANRRNSKSPDQKKSEAKKRLEEMIDVSKTADIKKADEGSV